MKAGALSTVPQLKREFKRRQKEMGMSAEEAFEDIIGNLLFMTRQYRKASEQWMKAHDKLKDKYEPLVVELS